VWIHDDDIDLEYHMRYLVLPKPGTMAQMEALCARLHSSLLDRSRPLWEFYVIDGLESGQVAIYTKIHHALVDGGAGMALNTMMYDLTPEPREVEAPPPKLREASKQLDPGMLLGTAYSNFLSQQIKMIQAIPDVWKTIANFTLPDPATLKLPETSRQPLPIAPRTSLNGAITSQRIYTARSVPLAV